MPDRIIRDELLDSSRWVSLKDNADRLAFLALLLKADAHGNFTADHWRLKRLWSDFGIREEAAVAKTLSELVEHDLVRLYQHDGTQYLHIPRYRQVLRYTKRALPRSPWCPTEEKQEDATNSHGDSEERTKRALGAHLRKKEGMKERMNEITAGAREAVDNFATPPTPANNLANPQPPQANPGESADAYRIRLLAWKVGQGMRA